MQIAIAHLVHATNRVYVSTFLCSSMFVPLFLKNIVSGCMQYAYIHILVFLSPGQADASPSFIGFAALKVGSALHSVPRDIHPRQLNSAAQEDIVGGSLEVS